MDWTENEINELLTHLQSLPESAQMKSYKSVETGLNWDKISEKLEGRNGEECKAVYVKLVAKVRKYRTMQEILKDAMESLKTNGLKPDLKKLHPDLPKKPVTAFGLFVRKRAKKMPGLTGPELMTQLSKSWNGLTEEKKESYRRKYLKGKLQYEEDMDAFRKNHPDVVVANSARPQPPQPSKLFVESRLEKTKGKHPDLSHAEIVQKLMKKYEALSDKKKLKWINKAKESMQSYQEQCDAYVAHKPSASVKPAILHLSKEEQRILNVSLGKPVSVPPKSTVSHLPIAEQSKTLSTAYHELSKEKLQELEENFKQEVEDYVKAFSTYYQSLSEEDRQKEKVLEEALAPFMRILHKNIPRKPSTPKAKKVQSQTALENEPSGSPTSNQKKKLSEVLPLPHDSDFSTEISKTSKRKLDVSGEGTPSPPLKKKKKARVSFVQNGDSEQLAAADSLPGSQKSPTKSKFPETEDSESLFKTQKSPKKSKRRKGEENVISANEETPNLPVTLASEDLLTMWSPLKQEITSPPSQENTSSSPSKKGSKSPKKSQKSRTS